MFLKLAQLRELQEHVVAVERRNDQPRRTVADAAVRDVVAQERERRGGEQLEHPPAAAVPLPLPRGGRRVGIRSLEMIRDGAGGRVVKLAPPPARLPVARPGPL